MKIDPGMHIGLHLVFFGKTGVTIRGRRRGRIPLDKPETERIVRKKNKSGKNRRGS
jgi:hypothetical protein